MHFNFEKINTQPCVDVFFSCHLVAFQNAAFFRTQVLSDAVLSSEEGFHTGFLPVSSFYLNGEFMAAGI
jgi:hypothetical protein